MVLTFESLPWYSASAPPQCLWAWRIHFQSTSLLLPQASYPPHFFLYFNMDDIDPLEQFLVQMTLMMNRYRKSQPPQQKAWTGTNPITQRASAPIPNGTDKSTSRPTSQSQPKPTETNGEKHAHDRALFLFASFTVRVTHSPSYHLIGTAGTANISCLSITLTVR